MTAPYYRIRQINAEQSHLSDHYSLQAAERAVRQYRRAGKDVRVVYVHADGSYSAVQIPGAIEKAFSEVLR